MTPRPNSLHLSQSQLLNKFCNLLMRSGNISKAKAICTQGFSQFLQHLAYPNSKLKHTQKKENNHNFVTHKNKENTHKFVTLKNKFAQHLLYPNSKLEEENTQKHKEKENTHKFVTQKSFVLLYPNSKLKQENTQKHKDKENNHNSVTQSPEHILYSLIENVRPLVEVRKVRVARATHQVPAQIRKPKGQTLALRWIIEFANKRSQKAGVSFAGALAQELFEAHKKRGGPRQRRGEMHRLAAANRSLMRFRWW